MQAESFIHQRLLLSKHEHHSLTNPKTSAHDNSLAINDSFRFWIFFHICVHPISNVRDASSSRAALFFIIIRPDVPLYFSICAIAERIYFGLESHTPLDANTIPVEIWFENKTKSYVFRFATSPSPR